MHELGIMIEIVDQVTAIAKRENVDKIEQLVLQVGEISAVIPHYLRACYPAAVHDTFMQDTELVIEMIPANSLCKNCKKVYSATEKNGICTHCGENDFDLLSGREFNIKEIVVREE